MKKTKRTRLLAAILTLALVFMLCMATPFTVSAAPEDDPEPGTSQTETPAGENPPAESEKKAPDGATPPYNSTGNIVENVRQNNPDATGLQFVVFKTASGKVFYLVIDFDKSADNVYLLTEVGEDDLLNFVEVDASGNPVNPPPGNNGNGQQNPGTTQPETPAQNNNIGLIVLVIAVLGIGGAAFYFFKSKKGGNKPLKAADYDFDDEDDYDEPTVNDDEQEDE